MDSGWLDYSQEIGQFLFIAVLILFAIKMIVELWGLVTGKLKTDTPCPVGAQRYQELTAELNQHDERITGLAKRLHEQRLEFESKTEAFIRESRSENRRIVDKLGKVSEELSRLCGLIDWRNSNG